VAGYTVLNDVSARDVQFKDHQITLGKNFATFPPMGPCLATPDELPDLGKVRLRSWVNDELMQDGSTADMIFSLAELLVNLTSILTLEPSDVVSTGTPSGVGVFRQPRVFLKPGDVVTVEVEGIGRLVNPVVERE
jgi:2,4-diketo-3-deoxy-L-fuconate hydrolase